jgi:hypothetical protein
VTRKPDHQGELEGNRKTIAQGMPVDPGEPVATTGAFFAPTTGAIGHPAFPAPLLRGRARALCFQGRSEIEKLGRTASREREAAFFLARLL